MVDSLARHQLIENGMKLNSSADSPIVGVKLPDPASFNRVAPKSLAKACEQANKRRPTVNCANMEVCRFMGFSSSEFGLNPLHLG